MAALTDAQRTFIVQRLACFGTPSEVAEAVKEEFGLDLPRQQVQYYDPTVGEQPAEQWRAIFEETREKYVEEVGRHGIAHKAYRLDRLQEMEKRAVRMGNLGLAADLLEQAAKEVGEKFTNRHKLEHSGQVDTGGPLLVPAGVSPEDWERVAAETQGGADDDEE